MDNRSLTVPPQDEMQILARVVRGDSYDSIATDFSISKGTITNIKNRNPETLAILQENLLAHRQTQASSILEKANKAIDKRIDESEEFDTKLAELQRQYRDGEIDEDVFRVRVNKLQRLSITELTSVSREMHAQSKTQNPDERPAMNPNETKEYLVNLAKGLESGDEVVLERLIFKKD